MKCLELSVISIYQNCFSIKSWAITRSHVSPMSVSQLMMRSHSLHCFHTSKQWRLSWLQFTEGRQKIVCRLSSCTGRTCSQLPPGWWPVFLFLYDRVMSKYNCSFLFGMGGSGILWFYQACKNSHNRMRYEKFAKHLILFSFP